MTPKYLYRIWLDPLVAALILFAIAWRWLPMQDYEWYFDFADHTAISGIPNFSNVVSNLPFLVSIFPGLIWIKRNSDHLPSLFYFLGLIIAIMGVLVTLGSSYFHWDPTPERLFWDRVPIVLLLMTMISLVVADRAGERQGLLFFFGSHVLALAILSLWYLNVIDLRPYIFLQVGGILVMLAITLRTTGRWIPNAIIVKTGVLYGLAKVFEMTDTKIFELTGFLGGHPIKHVVAAGALLVFISFYKNTPKKVGCL